VAEVVEGLAQQLPLPPQSFNHERPHRILSITADATSIRNEARHNQESEFQRNNAHNLSAETGLPAQVEPKKSTAPPYENFRQQFPRTDRPILTARKALSKEFHTPINENRNTNVAGRFVTVIHTTNQEVYLPERRQRSTKRSPAKQLRESAPNFPTVVR
jgi:hypothetical protein